MKREELKIWEEGEYTYAGACGFVPNLRCYLHEDGAECPAMLVVPGGGYRMVSPSEAEIVALRFFEKGYQAFVLTYTTNLFDLETLYLQPLQDMSRAVRVLRKHAGEFHIVPDEIVLCGFSAGAHLCGSLAVHWMDVEDENAVYGGISNRPDAAILSYPVITSGESAHRDSFVALLGGDAPQKELEYMSLEKQVTKNTSPIFLWQTVNDETVPVENSFLMAEALKKQGVPFALHIFSEGPHGMSIADEIWADSSNYGEPYTMEQLFSILRSVENGGTVIPESAQERYEMFRHVNSENNDFFSGMKPNREAAVWPELAEKWLEKILGLNGK